MVKVGGGEVLIYSSGVASAGSASRARLGRRNGREEEGEEERRTIERPQREARGVAWLVLTVCAASVSGGRDGKENVERMMIL